MTVLKIIWHNAERSVRERKREREEKSVLVHINCPPPSLHPPTLSISKLKTYMSKNVCPHESR
jgi:hypothetical protein